jgi:hypothetical protein
MGRERKLAESVKPVAGTVDGGFCRIKIYDKRKAVEPMEWFEGKGAFAIEDRRLDEASA